MNIQEWERIIDRYLAGIATPEEINFIDRWLHKNEEKEAVWDDQARLALKADLWKNIRERAVLAEPEILTARPPGKIISGSGKSENSPLGKVRFMGKGSFRPRKLFRYAAILLFLVAGGVFFYSLSHRQPQEVNYHLVMAESGHARVYVLPDNSTVCLFPHSSIQIPGDYGRENRTIRLSGKGVFDVRPDPGKPFYVRTGQLLTEVLGTSFEMAADNNKAFVTVLSGKVNVHYGDHQLAALTRDKQLKYDMLSRVCDIDSVNAAALSEWSRNIHSFQQVSLQKVLSVLGEWYTTPIEIKSEKWLEEKITIRFDGQSLPEAIALICETIGCRATIEKGRVIIY